ncbi:MAG TPA: type II toxin-antitoxin system PemK/MazF family toxin [Anaerolineae bacterium]|nr:type II toxin-antitoxin system PemK/MazF family toxin [Anaerolineae bacterium]
MLQPGDVVTVEFPGVEGIKRRPAVVVSTELYHRTRPDIILGLPTSQIPSISLPSDHVLRDWAAAGLNKPSAFCTFLATMPATAFTVIGRLSDSDWEAVQRCLQA